MTGSKVNQWIWLLWFLLAIKKKKKSLPSFIWSECGSAAFWVFFPHRWIIRRWASYVDYNCSKPNLLWSKLCVQPVLPWWRTLFESESLSLHWKAEVMTKLSLTDWPPVDMTCSMMLNVWKSFFNLLLIRRQKLSKTSSTFIKWSDHWGINESLCF